jgi:hypothetical protein
MMKTLKAKLIVALASILLLSVLPARASSANAHKNFRVAVYIPVGIVERMKDPAWLQSSWNTINGQGKVDKVYIETYRSRNIADEELIEQVKKFFVDHGVQVAGGLALSGDDNGQFQSICYTDPKDREYVKNVIQLTARHFDEIILDDFFFNNTKFDSDITAKGDKSWTQFRLGLMDEVSRDLILGAARAVNPKVKIIIKFPNWYEHFQGLGYDLDQEPKMFDAIYTGTETRDPVVTDQHLQQYESYQIYRYFENIKPGGNGGGWVDTYNIRYIDRYAEQLWDTMFAKAPEIMLFNWWNLLDPVQPGERDAWKNLKTSFNYDEMLAEKHSTGGTSAPTMAGVAGYSLEQVDPVVGQLGKPIGIKSYKPYQSVGEDFLHNYLGMIGIPIDLYPYFPTDADVILLTESAKFDPDIVSKIKAQLRAGKNVVITSGLLHALQHQGIDDIVETRYTDHKVLIHEYSAGFGAGGGSELGSAQNKPVLFPEIRFMTNDAWAIVRGMADGNGFPLLLMDRYSKGTLFVLTIPENFNDLYEMPQQVVTAIKTYIMGDFPVRLDAPNKVSLFPYDNNTFVVESYLDEPASATVSVLGGFTKLKNLATGEEIAGTLAPQARRGRRTPAEPQREMFQFQVNPHSYVAFAEEN